MIGSEEILSYIGISSGMSIIHFENLTDQSRKEHEMIQQAVVAGPYEKNIER